VAGYRITVFSFVAELVKSFDSNSSRVSIPQLFESLDDFRYKIGHEEPTRVGKAFPATSFAFADPVDKLSNFRMGQQRFDRVVVSPQLFLARHKFVNGPVAVTAHGNCHLHLLARVSCLKPLVAVASTRNQMVFGRAQFDNTAA